MSIFCVFGLPILVYIKSYQYSYVMLVKIVGNHTVRN